MAEALPDLAALNQPRKPNQYLAMPPGFGRARPHRTVPVFPRPAAELAEAVRAMALAQPRTILKAQAEDGLHMDFVQRSALFRFPDIVTVQIVPVDDARATLAIYSRSVYGHRDFGVNRNRVDDWLTRLA
ncbi:MAG: DUF1499 domain-containing protein [Sneathiellaceae bacterium]